MSPLFHPLSEQPKLTNTRIKYTYIYTHDKSAIIYIHISMTCSIALHTIHTMYHAVYVQGGQRCQYINKVYTYTYYTYPKQ